MIRTIVQIKQFVSILTLSVLTIMISSIVKIKQFVSIPTLSSRTNVIRTIVRIKMFLSIPTLFLRTSMILDSKVMIEMKQFVTLFYYSAKPKLKTPCGETLLTKWYWCHFMCRRSRLSLQINPEEKIPSRSKSWHRKCKYDCNFKADTFQIVEFKPDLSLH